VNPAPRQVRHNAADGSLVASGTANTICLQLAGGWLPLEDVSGGRRLQQQLAACMHALFFNFLTPAGSISRHLSKPTCVHMFVHLLHLHSLTLCAAAAAGPKP
jgi:hypothetical protein